ncbi:hypothetical protein ACQKWADRAFT_305548 [Trichoderma austrokoningii]
MKLTIAFQLTYTMALATADSHFQWHPLSDEPQFTYDPKTISPCILWYNNGGRDSCEYVRSEFKISPEDFHKWNPSVDLDCTPWNFQSYCLVSEGRLSSFVATASTTGTPSPKSAAETSSSKTSSMTTGSKITTIATTTTATTSTTTTSAATTAAATIATSTQSSGASRNRGIFF